jgi:regulator of protease activity HflC (stomatin/prohibitin superfamily)
MNSDGWITAIVAAVVAAVIVGIVVLTGVTFAKTDGGHLAVIRNGGPFDNNKIRDVLQPGSSRHFEGMYSDTHEYPASQRYYTITTDPGRGDRPGADIFRGSTSDGVNGVGIEGTVQFTLDSDSSKLKDFDNKFGTRTYPVVGSGDTKHAWDGDTGWSAFLDAVFRPILDNALRVELQQYSCVDLVPACAYVKGGAANGSKSNENLAKVQASVSQELQTDLDQVLGGHYLTVGTFRISKVDLPPAVSAKIDDANAAKAGIAQQHYLASQQVQQAEGEKNANIQKATGIRALNRAYANSPAKARIDAIAALPRGLKSLGGNVTSLIGTP